MKQIRNKVTGQKPESTNRMRMNFLSRGAFKFITVVMFFFLANGCNISDSNIEPDIQNERSMLSMQSPSSPNIGTPTNCPDVDGVVAPMFHPQMFNIPLRRAEGLLLPAVQAVRGHMQFKVCQTTSDTYQLHWSLFINNKEGAPFTGWSLIESDTDEELIGEQFSGKVGSNRMVKLNGTMEVGENFIENPSDFRIEILTTDPSQILIGLLLPAVQ